MSPRRNSFKVTIAQERNVHSIHWAGGARRETPELVAHAKVTVPGEESKSIHALVEPRDHARPQNARALGEHLWRALHAPREAYRNADIDLCSDDLEIRSLPWHLVHDGVAWLSSEGVCLRVHPQRPLSTAHLGSRLWAALVRPSDANDRLDWLDLLGDYSSEDEPPKVEVIRDPHKPFSYQGNVDLFHARIRCGGLGRNRNTLPLQEGGELPLAPFQREPEGHLPRILLLQLDAPPPEQLVREAARIAERCACVVLLPPPGTGADLLKADLPEGDLPDPALAWVRRLLEFGASPSESLRAFLRDEARPPSHWPRCFGGAFEPRPAPGDPKGRLYRDRGWRLCLDRRQQTDKVLGAVRSFRGRSRGGSSRRSAGIALLWYGVVDSGLERFHRRMEYELRDREGYAFYPVALGWPRTDHPETMDFADLYREAPDLGWDRHDFADALTRRFPPEADAAGQILYCSHDVLQSNSSEHAWDQSVLEDLVQWWVKGFAPGVPSHLLPVLAVGVEIDERAREQVEDLKRTLDKRRARFMPSRVFVLDELGEVRADDLVDLFYDYESLGVLPVNHIEPDDLEAIAEEIVRRTGGNYERTVHVVELLPWTWRRWLRRAKERRSP